MEEDRELVIVEEPVKDIMGNVLLRGHVVAYSKAGRGERSLNIGILTDIRPYGANGYYLHFATGSGYSWGTRHQTHSGEDASLVILNNPIYNLDSKFMLNLMASIDNRIGKQPGDIYERKTITNWRGEAYTYEYKVDAGTFIPDGYEFGVPWEAEQSVSIKNKKAKKRKKKA